MGSREARSLAGGEIEVRRCAGLAEFEECVRLQRSAWGWAEIDVVPSPLFVVAAETGGQVLGAFAGSRMVGFTMALAAFHGNQRTLHSHMTAVDPAFRDRGIGRRLKLLQRDDALTRGITLIEWSFDPLELKNAHFNLNSLGATVRRFIPNMYGITTSPMHGGLPTDRLMAEWRLDSPRVNDCLAAPPRKRVLSSDARCVTLPSAIGELRRVNPGAAAAVQQRIAAEFQKCFSAGYEATAFDLAAEEASYILEKRPEAPHAH